MFPDNCERCGKSTTDLIDCKKNTVTNWFICHTCVVDEFCIARERITELKGVIDKVLSLDPLFPDDLLDELKKVIDE